MYLGLVSGFVARCRLAPVVDSLKIKVGVAVGLFVPVFNYFLVRVCGPQPLVRTTACWTLGTYASMIGSDDSLLPGIIRVLLPACLDHTKKVQRTGKCA